MYPFESLIRRLFGKSVKRLRAELAEAEARLGSGAARAEGKADAEAQAVLARGKPVQVDVTRTIDEIRPLAMDVVKCQRALRARLTRRQLEAELAELRAARDRHAAGLVDVDTTRFNPAVGKLRILDAEISSLESYLKYEHDWANSPLTLPDLLTLLGLGAAAFVVVVVIDGVMTWMAAGG